MTDGEILKALNHPLRRKMLVLLGSDAVSPSEIAAQLGISIGSASYHMTMLRQLGMIKVVRETQKRGTVERHYQATSDGVTVRQVVAWAFEADKATPKAWDARVIGLDAEGVQAVRKAVARMWADVEKAERGAARRLGATAAPERHAVTSMIVPTDGAATAT